MAYKFFNVTMKPPMVAGVVGGLFLFFVTGPWLSHPDDHIPPQYLHHGHGHGHDDHGHDEGHH